MNSNFPIIYLIGALECNLIQLLPKVGRTNIGILIVQINKYLDNIPTNMTLEIIHRIHNYFNLHD